MQRNNSINNNLWQKRSAKPPKTSSQITSQFIDSNKDFLKPKFANEDEISKQQEIELEYNYSKELNHFHLKKSRKVGKDKENRQKNDNSSEDESYTNSAGQKNNNRNRLNSQSLANLQLNSTKLPKLQADQQSNSKREDSISIKKRDLSFGQSNSDKNYRIQQGTFFSLKKNLNSKSNTNLHFYSKPQSKKNIEDQESSHNQNSISNNMYNIKENDENDKNDVSQNSNGQSPGFKQNNTNFIQQNKIKLQQQNGQNNLMQKKNNLEELKYRIQKKTNMELILGKNNYQNQNFVNQIGNINNKNGQQMVQNNKNNAQFNQSKRSYTPISQANKLQLHLNQNGKDLNSPKNDSDKKDQDENNRQQKSQKQVRKNHIVQISHLSKAGANLLGTKTNQDNFLIKKNLNGKPDRYLLCVFDGHGQYGHQVSAFLKNTLVRKIENNFQRDLECDDDEFVKSSLNLSFLQTSQALLESSIEVQYSGSTCVCILIINNTIWSANVGDSRAVISRGLGFSSYKIEELTEDQKVDSPLELQRILAKGGRAEPYRDENGGQLGPYRVWLKDQDIPGLAMARSFGDIVATEAGVISTPEIKKFNMTEEDRYIILASDGVWEFINSQQASNMVQSYYIKNQPDQACSKLVKESTSLWKQNDDVIDDITAVIAFFKRPQKGFQKISQNNLNSQKKKNGSGDVNNQLFQ